MLKKRIIGVVTVIDNIAVQSFGYKKYLPLGDPAILIENLDKWGADEIHLQVIDRSKQNKDPHYSLIEQVADMGLSTPLIYSGGIKNVESGINVISRGADRIVLDSILRNDPKIVKELAYSLGTQAIIGCLTLGIKNNKLQLFDYVKKKYGEINKQIIEIVDNKMISELLIVDFQNEGVPDSFNKELINQLPFKDPSLILFGGISKAENINKYFSNKNVKAVGIGNFLNYTEDSIFIFKKLINENYIRI